MKPKVLKATVGCLVVLLVVVGVYAATSYWIQSDERTVVVVDYAIVLVQPTFNGRVISFEGQLTYKLDPVADHDVYITCTGQPLGSTFANWSNTTTLKTNISGVFTATVLVSSDGTYKFVARALVP